MWGRARSAILAVGLLLAMGACAQEPAPSAQPAASTSPASASPAASASSTTPAEPPTPTVVAEGVVSTDDEEYRLSFAPDGRTAYFARGSGFFPQSREATIYEATFVGGSWSEPTVAAFSGTYPDLDPWVAPDGQSIVFSSIRPVDGEERTDVELFRVDRAGDGWSEPVHLAALGSDGDELGASVSAAGEIWFASDRTGGAGGWDLYTATPDGDAYGEPRAVESLNTSVWEFNPAIDAEGETVVFTSINRPGGSGLGDLFVSTRDGDAWSEAQPLAINSAADEYHPSRSPDGATLYFLRRAADGDLYEVPWPAVAPGG